jgi:hypothetical protein
MFCVNTDHNDIYNSVWNMVSIITNTVAVRNSEVKSDKFNIHSISTQLLYYKFILPKYNITRIFGP